jgi:hypothetical protein
MYLKIIGMPDYRGIPIVLIHMKGEDYEAKKP